MIKKKKYLDKVHDLVIKGVVAKFDLFFCLPTNLSEICTQYVKLNQESIYAISFI